MPLSGSRTEFLQADALAPTADIKYSRSGGWFVSTKKALVLGLIVLAALVLVGVLVHYLQPGRKQKDKQEDAQTSADSATAGPSRSTGGAPHPSSSSSTTTPGVPPGSAVSPPAPEESMRLPDAVTPYYYTMRIQPFIGGEADNFTCKSNVAILLACKSRCDSITLHAKGLDIAWEEVAVSATRAKKHGANATDEDNVPLLKVIAHSEDQAKETITVQVDPALDPAVNYTLLIPFWSKISDTLRGFYRSVYTELDGTKKSLAVTQFQPTYAREAFPCFDEPAFKAQFEIHIARRDNLTSQSNMPLALSEPVAGQPGWQWDHFQPSPMMSTYLVAYMVSEFGAMNSSDGDPKFSVLARKSQIKNTNYPLDIGKRVLDYFNGYFDIRFPLPKVDMVALPDFDMGAMENWGLVTYREAALLFDPKTSTTAAKQKVAAIIAHELAHQWFGNLVTIAWWSDLWLNEGFATYVAYIGVDNVEPTWEFLDRFVIIDYQRALYVDSLESTHAIYVEVNTPGQIAEVFDAVSYSKGACLVRMLNHSLTEPLFRSGLKDYLNTWRYANAKQDDLWTALTRASSNQTGLLPEGRSVKDVMDTWSLYEGYPVVTVTRDYSDGSMTLTQHRFRLEHGSEGSAMPTAHFPRWFVPVSYTSQEEMRVRDTRPRVWLDQQSDRRVEAVSKPGKASWVLVNLEQTGYYRVNYDDTNWELLAEYLQTAPVDSLPVMTRAQLLDDAFNLARAGLLDYGKVLNLTLYLSRERSFVPWMSFFNNVKYLNNMLVDSSAYGNLQRYVEHLVTPAETLLGVTALPGDTQPQRMLRSAIIETLLRDEVPRHVEWAVRIFRQWINSSEPGVNPIPVDLRSPVYCAAIRAGGTTEWKQALERFEAPDVEPQERLNLLESLSCTRKPYLITTLLEKSVEEGGSIKLQDMQNVWVAVAKNPVAPSLVFRWVRQHWDDLYRRYGQLSFVLKALVVGSTRGLNSALDLQDLLEFEEAHKGQFKLIERSMAQAIEGMRLKVSWRMKYQKVVVDWLAQHVKTLA